MDGEVDRKCWTLHRPGSVHFSTSVLSFFDVPANRAAGTSVESRSLSSHILESTDSSKIGRVYYIPLEEESWAGQDVNDFD